MKKKKIFTRAMAWLLSAGMLFGEVSTPFLSQAADDFTENDVEISSAEENHTSNDEAEPEWADEEDEVIVEEEADGAGYQTTPSDYSFFYGDMTDDEVKTQIAKTAEWSTTSNGVTYKVYSNGDMFIYASDYFSNGTTVEIEQALPFDGVKINNTPIKEYVTSIYFYGVSRILIDGEDEKSDPYFSNMRNLYYVWLGNMVYLPKRCFENCSSLHRVSAPHNQLRYSSNIGKLLSIDNNAFKGCYQLYLFEFRNVKAIGSGAFETNSYFYNSMELQNCRQIQSGAFVLSDHCSMRINPRNITTGGIDFQENAFRMATGKTMCVYVASTSEDTWKTYSFGASLDAQKSVFGNESCVILTTSAGRPVVTYNAGNYVPLQSVSFETESFYKNVYGMSAADWKMWTKDIKVNYTPANASNKRVYFYYQYPDSKVVDIIDNSDEGKLTLGLIDKNNQPVLGYDNIYVEAVDGVYRNEIKIRVFNEYPYTIAFESKPETINIGETITVKAKATPGNPSETYIGINGSDSTIAEVVESNDSVDQTSATITGKKAGTITVTAGTASDYDFHEDHFTLTVVDPASIAVTGVTISPKTLSLKVGATGNLSATVVPSNAANKAVSYSSSNTSVATVTNTGVVTAVAPGTATVTVKTEDGNKTDTCTVTVTEDTVSVASVSLTPKTLSLKKGSTGNLTATVLPSNATNKAVTYSSNNTSVATVTNAGVVTAVSAGTATITVTTTDGAKTDTCTVTVTEDPATVSVSSVTISPKTLTVSVGQTKQVSATVAPENATNKAVTYTSSKPSVATVAEDGTVTGVAAGEAVIIVTTVDGGKTDSCTVTVTPEEQPPVSVNGVTLIPKTVKIKVGETAALTATVTPDDADDKSVTYTSSRSAVATVSETGVITGVAEGETTITVTTTDGGFTDTCSVTVEKADTPTPPGPVDGDTFNVTFYADKTTSVLTEQVEKGGIVSTIPTVNSNVGEFIGWYDRDERDYWSPSSPVYRNTNIYARYVDENGNLIILDPDEDEDDGDESYDDIEIADTAKDIYMVKGQKIRVMGLSVGTSNKKVLSVSKAKNNYVTLTAKKEGSVQITIPGVSGNTITHMVYVETPALSDKALKLAVGESKDFSVRVGSNTDKYSIFYSVANPDIAAIQDGKVIGIGKGSTTVVAHINGKQYKCKVTVTDPKTAKSADGATDISLAPLQQVAVKAKGFNAKKATWTMSTDNIVTITKGKITAVGVGTTTVTGVDPSGVTKAFSITVKAPTPQIIHLNVGKSKAAKFYKLSNKKAAWTVSDNTIASVTGGKIKGLAPGTTKVTAKYNNFDYSVYVVVEEPALKESTRLTRSGKTYALSVVRGEDYTVTFKGVNQKVTFTSDKPEIARVNRYGRIISSSAGKAKLTAKVNGQAITIIVNVFDGNPGNVSSAADAYAGSRESYEYEANKDYKAEFTVE